MTALVAAMPAFSQGGSTGRITGAVSDQTGGVLAGATVSVTDTQRGTSRTLTTDQAGAYNAPELTPGTYTVKAQYAGFKATERQNIVVEVGKEYRVDLVVEPGAQSEQVTVAADLAPVETTNGVLGGTISNQLILELPVQGRNFQKLLELRPGTYLAPGSGKWSLSSNGMRREHNVYILNGMDTIEGFSSQSVVNATPIFGDATSIVPIDAIQEFNTQQVPKAEYGWKPGAVVNVGLRSGENTLHGTAYAFGRSDAMDARNPFIQTGAPKQMTEIEDFGGTAGGHIRKDRLFYLVGYEGQRNTIGAPSSSLSLPTRASLGNISQSVLDACNALASHSSQGPQPENGRPCL
ncbi:MAG: carboxypeptidase regulatory-like domain-containing protein [Acidobacteriota bacterium]|nr:carboxypeptidase regulatory-like domain-containing protein [Acidobacteriota bacterium]